MEKKTRMNSIMPGHGRSKFQYGLQLHFLYLKSTPLCQLKLTNEYNKIRRINVSQVQCQFLHDLEIHGKEKHYYIMVYLPIIFSHWAMHFQTSHHAIISWSNESKTLKVWYEIKRKNWAITSLQNLTLFTSNSIKDPKINLLHSSYYSPNKISWRIL